MLMMAASVESFLKRLSRLDRSLIISCASSSLRHNALLYIDPQPLFQILRCIPIYIESETILMLISDDY